MHISTSLGRTNSDVILDDHQMKHKLINRETEIFSDLFTRGVQSDLHWNVWGKFNTIYSA